MAEKLLHKQDGLAVLLRKQSSARGAKSTKTGSAIARLPPAFAQTGAAVSHSSRHGQKVGLPEEQIEELVKHSREIFEIEHIADKKN